MNFVTFEVEDSNLQNRLGKIGVEFFTEFFLKFGRSCLVKQIDPNRLIFNFPDLTHVDKQFEAISEFLIVYFNELNLFSTQMSLKFTVNEAETGVVNIDEHQLFGLCCSIKQIFLNFSYLFQKNMNSRLIEVVDASNENGQSLTKQQSLASPSPASDRPRFKILKPNDGSSVPDWREEVSTRIALIEQTKLAKLKLASTEIDLVSKSELERNIVAFLNRTSQIDPKLVNCEFIANGKLLIFGYQKEVETLANIVMLKKAPVSIDSKIANNQPAPIKPVLVDSKIANNQPAPIKPQVIQRQTILTDIPVKKKPSATSVTTKLSSTVVQIKPAKPPKINSTVSLAQAKPVVLTKPKPATTVSSKPSAIQVQTKPPSSLVQTKPTAVPALTKSATPVEIKKPDIPAQIKSVAIPVQIRPDLSAQNTQIKSIAVPVQTKPAVPIQNRESASGPAQIKSVATPVQTKPNMPVYNKPSAISTQTKTHAIPTHYNKPKPLNNSHVNKKLNFDSLVIDSKSSPLEWGVLSRFDGKFFKEFAALLNLKYDSSNIEIQFNKNESRFVVEFASWIKARDLHDFIKQHYFHNFRIGYFKLGTNYQLQMYEEVVVKEINPGLVYAELDNRTNTVSLLGEREHVDRIFELIAKYESPPLENAKISGQKRENEVCSSKFSEVDSKKIKIPLNTAKIGGLCWFQTRLMASVIDSLKKTYANCEIALNFNFNEITFRSECQEEMEKAKSEAMSALKRIVADEIECENKQAVITDYNRNMKYYTDLLAKNGVACVIDINTIPGTMLLYSMSFEQIKKCQAIICQNRRNN